MAWRQPDRGEKDPRAFDVMFFMKNHIFSENFKNPWYYCCGKLIGH